MIDFGLLALFTLQVLMVLACYHVWSGLKGQLREVLALKEDIRRSTEAGNVATSAMQALAEEVENRVKAAEAVPGALTKRVNAVEEKVSDFEAKALTLGDRITSLGARLSASLRGRKRRDEDDEETGPAAEAEGTGLPSAEFPPGPLFEQQQPPETGIRPGFGVLRRRVG